MSFKLLRLVLKIGQYLALTSDYNKLNLVKFSEKLYAYFMVSFITVNVGYAFKHRLVDYVQWKIITALIQVSLDVTLYVMNIHTILTHLSKKYLWYKLLKKLKTVKVGKNKESTKILQFIISNICYWLYQIYISCVWSDIMGVEFFKQFAVEFLQLYNQFLICFLLYLFLNMLLFRYQILRRRLQNHLMEKQTFSENINFVHLYRLKSEFCVLKEASDLINSIFGWSFQFVIVYASLQILTFFNVIIVVRKLSFKLIFYSSITIMWQAVSCY